MAIGKKTAPTIAITMGDPAGIGPEVILKTAATIGRRRGAPSMIAIGDLGAMRAAASRLKDVATPREWHPGETIPPISKGIGVLSKSKLSLRATRPGHPTVEGAGAAYDYIVDG